jgi:hypothetical protein
MPADNQSKFVELCKEFGVEYFELGSVQPNNLSIKDAFEINVNEIFDNYYYAIERKLGIKE